MYVLSWCVRQKHQKTKLPPQTKTGGYNVGNRFSVTQVVELGNSTVIFVDATRQERCEQRLPASLRCFPSHAVSSSESRCHAATSVQPLYMLLDIMLTLGGRRPERRSSFTLEAFLSSRQWMRTLRPTALTTKLLVMLEFASYIAITRDACCPSRLCLVGTCHI